MRNSQGVLATLTEGAAHPQRVAFFCSQTEFQYFLCDRKKKRERQRLTSLTPCLFQLTLVLLGTKLLGSKPHSAFAEDLQCDEFTTFKIRKMLHEPTKGTRLQRC